MRPETSHQVIADKGQEDCGRQGVLVVDVAPILTGTDELAALFDTIIVPSSHKFVGVYLTGDFPVISSDTGGYGCWGL